MKQFSIQSLAIGIGIGMIIAAVINILLTGQPIDSLQNSDPFIEVTRNEKVLQESISRENITQENATREDTMNQLSIELNALENNLIETREKTRVTGRVYGYE
ncbi:hypothetical protein [Clostridium formicaceticum]|uniref:Uncharacterized protein n=1 Tax=Clostridium formicaceticum TaxID=1497 RepID=A0AAC9RIR9_9CLOT|nr:hypothetical protein [Clostridium formicaceticum]AOY77290.1 hypothetical protein BJL90_16405 [Clostridium formicaceticum]ARE87831.1 hypothetical protein CLFO_22310 [Clostridium formicaceticum]